MNKIHDLPIFYLILAQSGFHFTHKVPLSKGYALTLNKVSRSKVKVISYLCKKKKKLSFTCILSAHT